MARRRAERTVRAVPRFLKAKRALPDDVQEDVDRRVREIMADPLMGDPKVGALRGVRVVKLKVHQQQFLLAYRFFPRSNVVEVLDIGPHENFYRDLQRYLGAR